MWALRQASLGTSLPASAFILPQGQQVSELPHYCALSPFQSLLFDVVAAGGSFPNTYHTDGKAAEGLSNGPVSNNFCLPSEQAGQLCPSK